MMKGTLQKDGPDWYVLYTYPLHDRPIRVGCRYRVTHSRVTGPLAPEMLAGLPVTSTYPNPPDGWQAYKEGAYLVLTTIHVGELVPEQPIPCPKVKKGIETRYYNSRWEKFTKRDGWTAA